MSSPTPDRTGDRIAKLLARAGVASRREVERMIEDGRVKIGDEVVTTANTVLASLRGVTVDGVPVKTAEAARLFLFHKPSGLITAQRDPTGRPTIYTALRNALPPGTPRMMPVGRLDLNTEGLLLLTNDGELKRALELPSSGVPRTYRARTFGEVSQAQLEELIEGVTIEGMHYGKIDANLERKTGRNQWLEMTLTEGKNREVRRVLEHLGLQVSRLLRTSYGPFELLDLPRGSAVEIRQVDVEKFVKSLKTGITDQDFKPRSIVPEPKAAPVRVAAPRDPGRAGKPFRAAPTGRSSPTERSAPSASFGPTGASDRRPSAPPRRSGPSAAMADGPRVNTGRRAARGAASAAAAAEPRPERTTDGRRAPSPGFPPASPYGARPARDERSSRDERSGGGAKAQAPKRDARDRGEKLLDRPRGPKAAPTGPKPSGWAKAKPKGKPGSSKPGRPRK